MPVLCTDCAHIVLNDPEGEPYCNNAKHKSPVTGQDKPVPAETVRADMSKCGPEGRWFEANTHKFSRGAPPQEPVAG